MSWKKPLAFSILSSKSTSLQSQEMLFIIHKEIALSSQTSKVIEGYLRGAEQMRKIFLMLLMLLLCSMACCCYNESFLFENNSPSTTAASPSALAQQASPSASPVQPATQNNTFAFAPYLY